MCSMLVFLLNSCKLSNSLFFFPYANMCLTAGMRKQAFYVKQSWQPYSEV